MNTLKTSNWVSETVTITLLDKGTEYREIQFIPTQKPAYTRLKKGEKVVYMNKRE